jgi:ribosomal protein S18 acetylase RimI-like enzyme
MPTSVYVRDVRREDIPAIVAVEDRTSGVSRPEYWAKRYEIAEALHPRWASLVAEADGRVVGFLFGHEGELEFGLPGTVAWVEIIGVDPAYRRRGIAAKLMEAFVSNAEQNKIDAVLTLVDRKKPDMQGFFSKLGFEEGQMVYYQKPIRR